MNYRLGVILSIFVLLFVFIFGFTKVIAFEPLKDVCSQSGAKDSGACNTTSKDPITGKDGIILKAAKILALVIGVLSVIIIIIGGLQYVLAGGNPEKAASARSMILYAVVGLIVAAMAQALVVLVLSKL